ncbi:MAG: ribonuclease P protein component [Gammaproteobacteria bacterium]|nr:MAG: ribonuclease P protein component [Gammaproteobacteria bacterium]
MIPSSNISFDRVIETGHRLSNQYYKLFYIFKNNGTCRLGISLPKSVISKAHDRNRLKRVIRNSMDPLKKEKLDLVFLLKKNRVQYSKNDDMIVRDHLIRDSKTILLKKDNDGIS